MRGLPESERYSTHSSYEESEDDSPTNALTPLIPWMSSTWLKRIAIATLVLLVVVVNLGRELIDLPMKGIIEFNYCKGWYLRHSPESYPPDGNFPESMCHVGHVQQRTEDLRNSIQTASLAINLLVSIPYSFIANRIGPIAVLFLNIIAFSLNCIYSILVLRVEDIMPTDAQLAAPFFLILGGNELIWAAASLTIANNLADNEVTKICYIAFIDAAIVLAPLLLPPLSLTASITWNSWKPVWAGLALLLTSFPILLILYTTLYLLRYDRSCIRTVGSEEDPLLTYSSRALGPSKASIEGPFSHSISTIRSDVSHLLQLIFRQWNFRALLGISTLFGFTGPTMLFLEVYIPRRFGWTNNQAIDLLIGKAITTLFFLVFITPLVVKYIGRKVESSLAEIQLRAAKLCLATSVAGALGIGLSSIPATMIIATIVFAIGPVVSVFIFSLTSSHEYVNLQDDRLIQVYTVIMLVRTIGSIGGSEILHAVWDYSLRSGGMTLGLPFIVTAIFPLVGIFILFSARV